MSTGRSAGTLKMMKDYVPLFSTGNYWPYEIADIYGVSHQHMYRLLGDIATTNGVTRESLLIRPHLKEHCNRGIKTGKRGTNEMKSQVHKLTAKNVRILIKRGFTLVDFCTKYHCDEVALRAQFGRLFKEREANVTWNEMLANAKKLSGGASGGANRTSATADVIKAADAVLTATMATEGEAVIAIIPPPRSDLDVLREREAELLREAEELKQSYFQKDRLYSAACTKTADIAVRIASLEKKVRECEQELEKAQHERDELDLGRRELAEQRQAKDVEIREVQRKIAELTTIQLIACANGVIEAIDAPEFTIDDAGFEKLYSEMVEDPMYENLRAKDIRLLARVICVAHNAEQNVKVAFDSEELQEFYDSRFVAPSEAEKAS